MQTACMCQAFRGRGALQYVVQAVHGCERRWGLGVLAYVLLTGRQPFSSPKTDDPMVVMRRIVDDNWHIKYPPYLSAAAKVRQHVG